MKTNDREETYLRAKERVDKLRGFYNHLVIYILINIGITSYKIIRNLTHGEAFHEAVFDLGTFAIWGLWGVGLGLHAFSVFGLPYLLGNNWEEEKIKQFMKEEEEEGIYK